MLYPQADHQHYFESLVQDKVFTHARIRIFPDGGVKRLRLLGIRVPETNGVYGNV
jgi:allantoicase